MHNTDPGHAAYDRLIAAQRIVSDQERYEIEQDDERERLKHRIKRRLPKVY